MPWQLCRGFLAVLLLDLLVASETAHQGFLHAHNVSSTAADQQEIQQLNAEGTNAGVDASDVDAEDSNTEQAVSEVEAGGADEEASSATDEGSLGEVDNTGDEALEESVDEEAQGNDDENHMNDQRLANLQTSNTRSGVVGVDDSDDAQEDGYNANDAEINANIAVLKDLGKVHRKLSGGGDATDHQATESDAMEDNNVAVLKTLSNVHRQITGATSFSEHHLADAVDGDASGDASEDDETHYVGSQDAQAGTSEDSESDPSETEATEDGTATQASTSEESDGADSQAASKGDESEAAEEDATEVETATQAGTSEESDAADSQAASKSDENQSADTDSEAWDNEADDFSDYKYEPEALLQASAKGIDGSDATEEAETMITEDLALLKRLGNAHRKLAGEDIEHDDSAATDHSKGDKSKESEVSEEMAILNNLAEVHRRKAAAEGVLVQAPSDDAEDAVIFKSLDNARRRIAGESIDESLEPPVPVHEEEQRETTEVEDEDAAMFRKMGDLHKQRFAGDADEEETEA